MNELDVEIVVAAAKRAKRRKPRENRVADAVSATGTLVLGSAAPMAAGSAYTATSQALGGAAHDAAHGQAAANELLHTSTTIGVGIVYDQVEPCTSCKNGDRKSCHCHDPGKRRRPVPVRPQRRARRR